MKTIWLKNDITFQVLLSTIFIFLYAVNVKCLAQEVAVKDTTQIQIRSKSDEYFSQGLTGDALSVLIDKDYPNSIPIPGTNIRFKVGGFIKTDFIVDLDYIGDRSEFVTGTIALDGSPEKQLGGRTTFHAKESRISFDFRSRSKKEIPLRAFIDLDFFGSDDPNNYNLRLRNAAITVGNLLIGHTWETVMDLNALPTTIDFEIYDAVVFGRTVLVRWEQAAGKQFKWAVALENPGASIDNPYELDGQVMQYIPNTVARITWNHRLGHLQLAGLGTQLRWVSDSLGSSSALGIGFNFSGSLKFAKYDKFMWTLAYGKGWGQNIAGLSGSGSDAVLNEDGSLNAFPVLNISAGIEHYWLSNLATTLAFGWASLDSPVNRSPDAQELAATYHINLRWGALKNFIVGIEYMGGKQQIVDGTEGFAQRIQLAARYNFN
jgi:hypothetical protein